MKALRCCGVLLGVGQSPEMQGYGLRLVHPCTWSSRSEAAAVARAPSATPCSTGKMPVPGGNQLSLLKKHI